MLLIPSIQHLATSTYERWMVSLAVMTFVFTFTPASPCCIICLINYASTRAALHYGLSLSVGLVWLECVFVVRSLSEVRLLLDRSGLLYLESVYQPVLYLIKYPFVIIGNKRKEIALQHIQDTAIKRLTVLSHLQKMGDNDHNLFLQNTIGWKKILIINQRNPHYYTFHYSHQRT